MADTDLRRRRAPAQAADRAKEAEERAEADRRRHEQEEKDAKEGKKLTAGAPRRAAQRSAHACEPRLRCSPELADPRRARAQGEGRNAAATPRARTAGCVCALHSAAPALRDAGAGARAEAQERLEQERDTRARQEKLEKDEIQHAEAMRRVHARQDQLLPFLLTVGVPARMNKVVGTRRPLACSA
jgi:hypothetical protein